MMMIQIWSMDDDDDGQEDTWTGAHLYEHTGGFFVIIKIVGNRKREIERERQMRLNIQSVSGFESDEGTNQTESIEGTTIDQNTLLVPLPQSQALLTGERKKGMKLMEPLSLLCNIINIKKVGESEKERREARRRSAEEVKVFSLTPSLLVEESQHLQS